MNTMNNMSESKKEFDVIIEVPVDSNLKYEIDAQGNLRLDRILSSSMSYPGNYGYIPNTLADDGDALDALVMVSYPLQPKSIIRCRPIGYLSMRDEKGLDEKVVLVPVDRVDPHYDHITEISDIGEASKKKIEHFFQYYKSTEPEKWTQIEGWCNAEESYHLIEKYHTKYISSKSRATQ